MAVNHQADDDEEDGTQYGEEHGEENGYSAHAFFSLTHWEERTAVKERVGSEFRNKG